MRRPGSRPGRDLFVAVGLPTLWDSSSYPGRAGPPLPHSYGHRTTIFKPHQFKLTHYPRASTHGRFKVRHYRDAVSSIRDEDLIDVFSRRLPDLLERRPDLEPTIFAAFLKTFARREEVALVLTELRAFRTEVVCTRSPRE